ncbi:hypothetical protein C8A05DRAFT_18147 [Staphylotrichum tortipilum]|uniref:Anaphase-promoting complex subunit 2 n=1 Tax=Staphylotrichum tortipilum TaxID=2831512 RepID=A0AAN6RQT9_9PEZI|nr:hypothetical protein C8A05DRAFT_18147 [Staphylotrichum longicolle]
MPPVVLASQRRDGRQRRVFESVFQIAVAQPAPWSHSTSRRLPNLGLAPLGDDHAVPSLRPPFSQQQQQHHHHHHHHPQYQQTHHAAHGPISLHAPGHPQATPPTQPSLPAPTALQAHNTTDQAAYDRAWHVLTAHIALPASATNADNSSGTLPGTTTAPSTVPNHPHPQQQPSASGRSKGTGRGPRGRREVPDSLEFHDAFALVANAHSLLPRATPHPAGGILAWHLGQVRAHFAQHVMPLLAGCAVVLDDGDGNVDNDAAQEGRDSLEGSLQQGRRQGGRWATGRKGNLYERHMVAVMSSIRTLEAALGLYFDGLNQLLAGFARLAEVAPEAARDAELLNARFRRDLHALVGSSVSEGLLRSVKAVVVRLAGTVLGIPSPDETGSEGTTRPAAPGPGDLQVQAARERLVELVQQLHNVGLAGERFQVLFAEVMDAIMSAFVTGAYAGLWSPRDPRSFAAAMDKVSRGASSSMASPCIASLDGWVENHFARLSFEVLTCISASSQGPLAVSLADLKTYQSLALSRLAALRIQELFDIVLAWPTSRPALEDLRATITTTARRKQLTDSLARALQTRLLHPGCSTLEILQMYISIIRALHALDPSKVLLSHVESGLQLYLCGREDAVRVVVAGLLASPEEMRAARKVNDVWRQQQQQQQQERQERHQGRGRRRDEAGGSQHARLRGVAAVTRSPAPSLHGRWPSTPEIKQNTPSQSETRHPTKLIELALLLNDPSHQHRQQRGGPDDADLDPDLDWDDMSWLPDPIDAAANYKRPRSEDVIGTLISALGSAESFIKEFAACIAERLLIGSSGGGSSGDPHAVDGGRFFEQELRVLELLKRRFGEALLQGCDVMIRDIWDSRRVDTGIRRAWGRRRQKQGRGGAAATPEGRGGRGGEEEEEEEEGEGDGGIEYHARILSRLFWPGLEREHFLLPAEVVQMQRRYEKGYEGVKSRRKLTWLNQMGQVRVELEMRDRTITVDCTPVEATVVYAFQGEGDGDDSKPVQKSLDGLYETLQMDEDLIAAALRFWTTKGVLRRVGGGSGNAYVVVETLGQQDATPTDKAPAAAAADEPPAAAEAGKPSAKERARREVYWRYVQGMLTNASASMPLAQVGMMLRMLIADGFPWSDEELGAFLGEKVAAGEMEVVGGRYRLVKK